MSLLLPAGALLLALVHVFAGRLPVLAHVQRTIWVSCAGGVAAAYVMMHLLPAVVGEAARSQWGEAGAYPVALLGLLAYVGIDRLGRTKGAGPAKRRRARWGFFPHLAAFAFYNGLVGYMLLRREGESPATELLYVFALGMHLLVVDRALRRDHAEDYDRIGRWLMAGAVLIGAALGLSLSLPPLILEAGFAFLAGGMIVNVIKEELPERGHYLYFALSAATYGAVLMLG
ncbi:MAG: hypothetical protein ACO1OK_03075 [Devosia sp.]